MQQGVHVFPLVIKAIDIADNIAMNARASVAQLVARKEGVPWNPTIGFSAVAF